LYCNLLRASVCGGFRRGLHIFRRYYSMKQLRGLLLELSGHESDEQAGLRGVIWQATLDDTDDTPI
jgi:hypothetical protein